MAYSIETFPVGLFQCNCALIWDDQSKKAIVLDPGGDFEIIQERIEFHKLQVEILWHTHAHLDHVGATLQLSEWLTQHNLSKFSVVGPEVFLHEEDRWLYENIEIQSKALGLPSFEVPANFNRIKNHQTYDNFPRATALHTPGHTPGSCCLRVDGDFDFKIQKSLNKSAFDDCGGALFTGDTLFRRSIGRTDLWGGDFEIIQKSIQKKIYTLPPRTLVIPGHGPVTTLEEEIDENPFVQGEI